MAKYRYVGGGAGVPGLPHEVSDVEAAELGVENILKDAIENGSYVAVDVKKESRPSTAATNAPPLRTKMQKESE